MLLFAKALYCSLHLTSSTSTAQKMKFSIKDFFDVAEIRRKLRIWSHLMKTSLMENFIFCTVQSFNLFEKLLLLLLLLSRQNQDILLVR